MKHSVRKAQFVKGILKWAHKNLREFPWRNSTQPKHILIAEILLQRTPANRVSKSFQEIIDVFNQDLITLDECYLKTRFRFFGLTKRFVWIKSALSQIEDKHNGKIPNTYEELVALPGVGEYTANAVLCLIFNIPVPMIDINSVRVLSRFFYGQEQQKTQSESKLQKLSASLVPIKESKLYNLGLLDFGAILCKKTPLCDICPLSGLCKWKMKYDKRIKMTK